MEWLLFLKSGHVGRTHCLQDKWKEGNDLGDERPSAVVPSRVPAEGTTVILRLMQAAASHQPQDVQCGDKGLFLAPVTVPCPHS